MTSEARPGKSPDTLWVWVHLPQAVEPVLCARFTLDISAAGIPVGRFVYGRSYLERADALPLDPIALPLQPREFTTTHLQGWFSVLLDAGPDAWGRRVIERRYGAQTLLNAMLLARGHAVGAIGFSASAQVPPAATANLEPPSLERVLAVHGRLEAGQAIDDDERELLMQESSAGGARPKVTIEDGHALWIAKGPSKRDSEEFAPVPCVEGALLSLAQACDIRVPRHYVRQIGGAPVLLVQRFDRVATPSGYARWRYASARSVFWAKPEVARYALHGSYTNLANQLRVWEKSPDQSVRELYRRIVFNCLVGNTDDHDQNHGLVADGADDTFRLSPAFDLTIRADAGKRHYLAMGFGEEGGLVDIKNLLSKCEHFGYRRREAHELIAHQWELIESMALARIVDNGCPEFLAIKSVALMPGHRFFGD
jgi:serine/threonine-protein kinase HipA